MVEHQFSKLRAGVRFSYPAQQDDNIIYMSFSPEKANRSSEHRSEESPLSELSVVSNIVQINLALMAYEDEHPGSVTDILHPETVSKTIRNSAMMDWIEKGNAINFRNYVSDPQHSHEQIDMNDEHSLKILLHTITRESDTENTSLH
jgi:hypothetical protein